MAEKSFFETIYERRSIRKFSDKDVPREDLEKILDAATKAPSGNNAQPWYFIVIQNHALKEAMRQAVDRKMDEILTWPEAKGRERRIEAYRPFYTFFDQAPVVIAILGKNLQSVVRDVIAAHGMAGRTRPSSAHQSVAAAIENLLLAATALGYGACWMTGPLIAAETLEDLLEVKEPWCLAALVPLGFPAQSPRPRPRKSLKEVVRYV